MKQSLKLFVVAGVLLAACIPSVSAQELEEVVVTAQRRAQDLQDVAISVSAFQRDDIADLGISDITLIAGQTPNLDIKYAWGNSMPIYTIRGIGMNSFQASDTSSVGLFVDDVFQTSIATMGAFLYDIERVEVLKGPQGTLFGRNTNGGAINYLTRAPSFEETEGFVRVDYGKYNHSELEAAFGGPLSDNWAARVSLMTIQQNEGWVFDRTSGEHIGEADIWAGRIQLQYQPNDDLSARLILFGSSDRSQPVYFQHIGTLDRNNPGQFCPAYLQNRRDPANCVDVLGYSDTDGNPYAGDYTNRLDTEINADARLRNDNFGATLLIDSKISDLDFRSISSFQVYDRFQPKESDGNPGLFVDFLFASEILALSQEFRLASGTEGRFSWIAGAQISYDEVEEDPDRIGYLDNLGLRIGLTYKQERLNAAAYGQGVWQLNDQWRLEVGGRILYDDVDFEATTYLDVGVGTGQIIPFVLAGCPDPAGVIPLDCQLDDTAITGKIGLDWSPNDDLMIYGSVQTGYKPGGFNGGLNTNSELYTPFEEEELTAFELGLKSTLWNGRGQLSVAGFIYDYEGLQAATPRPAQNQAGVLNFLTNLSEAEVLGIEAELRVKLAENVELNLGGALLDTENKDPGANFDGPLGNSPRKLANAPEESFNASLAWDVPLGDRGDLRLFTDYSYEGDHFKEIVNIPLLEITNNMWNARVTWTSPGQTYSVSLWGKNLSDEVYIVDTLGAGAALGWGVEVVGMPRTYGLSARVQF